MILERCQGLARRYEIAKPEITAMEVSLTLFAAVDANCLDLMMQLSTRGVLLDVLTGLAQTWALSSHAAAKSGHLQIVDLLLARGAPIHARNLAGFTALYLAAEGSHILIAQRLIERGADVKLAGRSGISPIAAAAYAGNDIIFDALACRTAPTKSECPTTPASRRSSMRRRARLHRQAAAGAKHRRQCRYPTTSPC